MKELICEACKRLVRYVDASDIGWCYFCVNPDCPLNGKIFKGSPPIEKIEIKVTMDENEFGKEQGE